MGSLIRVKVNDIHCCPSSSKPAISSQKFIKLGTVWTLTGNYSIDLHFFLFMCLEMIFGSICCEDQGKADCLIMSQFLLALF